jgi:two-component system C4-dicarboxylate transport sensor histidine kinase DctB
MIAQTLQYQGNELTPVADLDAEGRQGFGDFVERPVGRLGWRLMLFPDRALARRAGIQAALLCTLLLVMAAACAWAYQQRRRRLEERHAAQRALQQAAQELERKIAERTEQLTQANRQLEVRYDTLKETELMLRNTQNELVQAGKLAMLGQMAAGITHELNQPLTAIRAFADNARTFLGQGRVEPAVENLVHIASASARMGSIIGQLKGFARKGPQTATAVNAVQAIRAAVRLLQSEFERCSAKLQLRLEDAIWLAGDPVRIEQVLLNLLRNALDAVEEADIKMISVYLTQEHSQVTIRIADSGPGLEAQAVEHLFEPFFTTKPSGKGLGLGLAISSSIVQAMDGSLSATNNASGGAEFILRLPAAQEDLGKS